jgi:hypothetical protein
MVFGLVACYRVSRCTHMARAVCRLLARVRLLLCHVRSRNVLDLEAQKAVLDRLLSSYHLWCTITKQLIQQLPILASLTKRLIQQIPKVV